MTAQELIFTKKFPQKLYRHVIFWLVYYFFSLLTYFHPLLEKTTFGKWSVVETVEIFWHVFIQIIFCYTVLYFLFPRYFLRKKYVQFTLGIVSLSIVVYCISYVIQYYFFRRIHAFAGIPFLSDQLLYWYTFIAFISYTPLSTSLAIAFKVLKNFYIKQQENYTLRRENANAELQLLKAQVHPHFLFNTLNNIYALTLLQSMQAPQLVMNLSDTLQYMIADCQADTVYLKQEIKMIQDYIDLEKIRYGDRLNLQIEITGALKNKKIVPLLMIPFIENSFKHGAGKMLKDAWIKLFVQADENMLHFTLTNSKPMDMLTSAKGGIGLPNAKKRLELLYPDNHLLLVDSTVNTFTINMRIPLETI